ncbi:hypothetical protein M2160_000282 [Streptomyces sp. SAI-117]|nr:hypothetical protein [Streptomyces sp. SAI-117]
MTLPRSPRTSPVWGMTDPRRGETLNGKSRASRTPDRFRAPFAQRGRARARVSRPHCDGRDARTPPAGLREGRQAVRRSNRRGLPSAGQGRRPVPARTGSLAAAVPRSSLRDRTPKPGGTAWANGGAHRTGGAPRGSWRRRAGTAARCSPSCSGRRANAARSRPRRLTWRLTTVPVSRAGSGPASRCARCGTARPPDADGARRLPLRGRAYNEFVDVHVAGLSHGESDGFGDRRGGNGELLGGGARR